MVNLAEKQNGENSAQLADAEITRILSALHNAEFKKSETRNKRPDQTFKPRSLMEIAKAARQQAEAAEAAAEAAKQKDAAIKAAAEDISQADDSVDNTPQRLADQPAATPDMPPQMQPETQPEMPVEKPVAADAEQTVLSADQAPSPNIAAQPDAGPIADAAAPPAGDVGAVPEAPSETEQAAPTSPFETAQSAYDRGYGDGVAAGRSAAETELRAAIEAEAAAKFAEKIIAFETALAGLIKPQALETERLSHSLQAAVVKLAEARIGAAIEDLPELLISRIDALAEAAGRKTAAGRVFLHPDDHAVMAPIMAGRPDPVVIAADPALRRGDIRIRFDGIEVDDLLSQRLSRSLPDAETIETITPPADAFGEEVLAAEMPEQAESLEPVETEEAHKKSANSDDKEADA